MPEEELNFFVIVLHLFNPSVLNNTNVCHPQYIHGYYFKNNSRLLRHTVVQFSSDEVCLKETANFSNKNLST